MSPRTPWPERFSHFKSLPSLVTRQRCGLFSGASCARPVGPRNIVFMRSIRERRSSRARRRVDRVVRGGWPRARSNFSTACAGATPNRKRRRFWTGPSARAPTACARPSWKPRNGPSSRKRSWKKEQAKLRQDLHERERQLDKRQDTAEQQSEQLRRQERMVEGNQRKLAEKIEETNRRNEELGSLLDLQRQTLHKLSGLSRDEATKRLLDMLDVELTHEQGAMDSQATRNAWPKSWRPRAGTSCSPPCSAMPRLTRPKPPPAPSTFPATK